MNRLYFLLLFVPLFLASCKKKDERILFEVPYEFDFELSAGLSTFQRHSLEVLNISTKLDSLLSFNNLSEENINEIQGQEARFTMIIPSGDYSFFQEISVFVFDPVTQEKREIFFHDRVQQNTGDQLQLIPALTNVRDIMLEKDKFNILIEMQLREVTQQFIPTRFRFSLKAK